MAGGGTKIYCPGCETFQTCKAISPTIVGVERGQRWYRDDFSDISWFRRARECLDCGHTFLTAEVDEALIEELVELRKKNKKKPRNAVRQKQNRAAWLKRDETIPLELAQRFVIASTWWLTHSSGKPVRAPRHANHIYKSPHGWAVDFGANSFLVGKAIERCRDSINLFLDSASAGEIISRSDVITNLRMHISGAVANSDGYEYAGYYPITGDDLIFGASAIDVSDGARFVLGDSGVLDTFPDL